ncbi:MAG: DUF1801 domain-containing protein [Spirosomataceae bacterium]
MKTIETITFSDYLNQVSDERKEPLQELRTIMQQYLPKGFEERIGANGIEYYVPHDLYPSGYHCNPKQPLPFISIASQKNFIALYHMAVYADESLSRWFSSEYPNYSKSKLDMGKSCIRFKNVNQIPYVLIASLISKMTPSDWINLYEKKFKN